MYSHAFGRHYEKMPPNNLLYHRDLDKRSFWADWIAGRQSGRLYSPAGVPRGRITVWGTFQYRIRHLTVRFRKVSKARDKCLEVSDHSENCLASRQRCCRDACQISERYIYCIYIYIHDIQPRGFKTLWDIDVLSNIETGPSSRSYVSIRCASITVLKSIIYWSLNRWILKFCTKIVFDHYGDVKTAVVASRITGQPSDLFSSLFILTTKKHQRPALLSQRDSNAEMFPFDDVIMLWLKLMLLVMRHTEQC